MVDRFLAWLGAGAVLVGVSAGMLAGASVASAQDGAPSKDGGTSTSEQSKTPDSKQDSADTAPNAGESGAGAANGSNGADGTAGAAGTEGATAGDDLTDADQADQGQKAAEVIAPKNNKNESDSARTNLSAAHVTQPAADDANTDSDADDHDAALAAKLRQGADENTNDTQIAAVERKAVVIDSVASTDAEGTEDAAGTAAVTFAAAAAEPSNATATAPPLQGLLNLIGGVVFGIYGIATTILGGPPILPPNSGVTVRTSTLHLDCGCNDGAGVDVQADWYVPDAEEGQAQPDQLIYLQHGFLARGPWYSYTAAALAKETDSIVVAPSITSNFLASDACWLGGNAMHEAMARLFDDDNTALADSVEAAGYDLSIPDRVLLIGHSLGGGAVIGIAGAMADNHTEDRLAGVIMLDGVPFDPKAAESIAKVDPDIPIYNLASPRYMWNMFGVGTDALVAARPDADFIGVTLKDGSHVDSMRGGNPLIQFGQELVAGFVRPENGDAAQIIMIGWAKDMFAGEKKYGVYVAKGEQTTVGTPSGPATAVALPNALTKDYPLNFLQPFMQLGNGLFTIEPSCVAESMGTNGGCQASIAA